MSEATACIIYGPELNSAGNPKIGYDQLITDRSQLGYILKKCGVELALAHALPAEEGEPQRYNLLRHPLYDNEDSDYLDLDDAQRRYETVTGAELSETVDVGLDRWSANWGSGLPGFSRPTLNTPAVQQYGASKLLMHKHVLEPEGLGMPTHALLNVLCNTPDELAEVPLIVKPDDGGLGVGFLTFKNIEMLLDWAETQPMHRVEQYIVQPWFDLTGKLPGLTSYSRFRHDPTLLKTHNTKGSSKEVRVYTFYNAKTDTAETLPIPRVTARGTADDVERVMRDFFPAAPEPLDEILHEPAVGAVRRLAQLTGAPAVYAAVDMAFAAAPHSKQREWRAVELNCRFPHPIDMKTHVDLSYEVRYLLAGQIARLAGLVVDNSH